MGYRKRHRVETTINPFGIIPNRTTYKLAKLIYGKQSVAKDRREILYPSYVCQAFDATVVNAPFPIPHPPCAFTLFSFARLAFPIEAFDLGAFGRSKC